MSLTDRQIRAAKPKEKAYKLSDGRGMYLLVPPQGRPAWRLKYRYNGREKGISLGIFPDTPLKDAREKRDEMRRLLAKGIDPSAQRQSEKAARGVTFKLVSEEWLATQKMAPVTRAKANLHIREYVYPKLGQHPVGKITAADVLAILRPLEARGILDTTHRTKQRISQILRYAVATGRAERDVTIDLRGAIATPVVKQRAALTDPVSIGALLRAIDGYEGQPTTAAAMKLAPLVFVRPGELRAAEWSEFDLDGEEPVWRIPASRMKMGEQHLVPLAKQAVTILVELRALTGDTRLVFPSLRSFSRPLSNGTINAALRRLGYTKEQMTAHGFRALASTLLNEQGWHPDVIERQLAHAERNKVRGAYNRAQRLADRRKMMQAWADYLDGLRGSANVVPIKRSA